MSKANGTTSKKGGKAKWQGFVNVYLSTTERKHIKENLLSNNQLLDLFVNITEAGYKLSVTYAERPGFFTVTVYGQHAGGPNEGYAMSLRHASLRTALTAVQHCLNEAGLIADWTERYTSSEGHDW